MLAFRLTRLNTFSGRKIQVMACLFLGLVSLSILSAQEVESGVRKRAFVVRVPEGSIRVDGRLNDAAWEAAPAIKDFVQKEPNEGAEPGAFKFA